MKNKTVYKIIGLSVLVSLAFLSFLSSCETLNAASQSANNSTSSVAVAPSQNANSPTSSAAAPTAQQQAKNPYSGDGGKGITIAVPRPVMQNSTRADNWMPQLFQDLLTGDLAKFSAMKVIDRVNEQLVLAEQNNSASGNYSDDDYIKIGNLTNAQYIVAGNIQNVSGRYNVSFRINNTETNEIKATFNKAYPIGDIETGFAAKEAVKELLAGMGVTLTDAGEKSLLVIQQVEVRATAQLARGVVAANSNNIVESLGFLSEALGSNKTRNEANHYIHQFFGNIQTANIRERAAFAIAQKEKWEKIFLDLDQYMWRNAPIFVYDFSVVEDKIDISRKQVTIVIKPGIKVVPNRTALVVYKTIVDNWLQIIKNPENKDWSANVRMPRLSDGGVFGLDSIDYARFNFQIGLYDDYGDRIANNGWYSSRPNFYIKYYKNDTDKVYRKSDFQVVAQHKYYDEARFYPLVFYVPLDKVTDTLTPKIEKITSINERGYPPYVEYKFMSAVEWQTWVQRN